MNQLQILKTCVRDFAITELQTLMNKWCTLYETEYSGGSMRSSRGNDIEEFVIKLVHKIGTEKNVNLVAKNGKFDKKECKVILPTKEIKKDHQVDVHVYLNNSFILAIECKAYLDSCYYDRACNDFALFKKFDYNVKKVIFALEDSIDKDTKIFMDYTHNNICDGVFYMLDGKRSSSKPIYDKTCKKEINPEKVATFVDYICELC